MPGLTVAVILAVIGLSALAGALTTWFVLRFLSIRRSDIEESPRFPTEEEGQQPEPTAVLPVQPKQPVPILQVLRDENDSLQVYVHGQRYEHMQDISHAQTSRDAVEAVKTVLEFAEARLPATRRSAEPYVAKESRLTEDKLFDNLGHYNRFVPDYSSSPATANQFTLAEQINALVQKRLKERPDLANLHIKLGSSTNGALFIRVGGQVFDSVHAISHAEVRTLIQNAIREWENGQ